MYCIRHYEVVILMIHTHAHQHACTHMHQVCAVLEELQAILAKEGNEKAVVFSQFTTFLDVLGTALKSEVCEL
jgi:hypothetical protein